MKEKRGVQAVWAGWGHASENPKLPEALSKTKEKIAFIGPPSRAMRDLGDKIASTIIAQSGKFIINIINKKSIKLMLVAYPGMDLILLSIIQNMVFLMNYLKQQL